MLCFVEFFLFKVTLLVTELITMIVSEIASEHSVLQS